ncbi:hypothetical protein TGAMA5MH_07582 [Trichoderma gamsii]|uniref:Rhodanese domain-containing protein n=1 Tax=Trichoderma gamsii TaxID=398673 RepID=A0A2K0T4X6_9HYPO|nr:hypothetical protein TGAMA5MH_07582 [Trichoderma gamsii]
MASGESTAAPWHAAYPTPRNTEPATISREALLDLMTKSNGRAAKDFLLIDLRRTDNEGGMIRGSINLPAQSLYPTIPALYGVFKAAGLRKIIWFCSSSRGRGSRAALWFKDYIDDQGDSNMESLILFEGIKGWATAGSEFVQWIDGYNPDIWAKA